MALPRVLQRQLLVLPGSSVIATDIAAVLFDPEGHIIHLGRPHQFLTGDVADFCSVLADP
jgi:hypothetical protein